MIVFDVSTLIGAALKANSIPERALLRAEAVDVLHFPAPSIASLPKCCAVQNSPKYLELALAAGAETIVSSDDDLLVLDPWRGVRVLKPADYLALTPNISQ